MKNTVNALRNWQSICPSPFDPANIVANRIGTTQNGEAVTLSKKDKKSHFHFLGATGQGKSYLFSLLIREDILDERSGLMILDPHGELYEELLAYVSHEAPFLAERLVLFNPAGEDDHLLGFNPIPQTEHFHYALVMLIQSCLKAWGQDNSKETPRIRRWLYNIFYPIVASKLTLLETEPFTNLHDKEGRERLLATVDDERVLNDWLDFERASQNRKSEILEGASNRLNLFLQNPIVRKVIGQKEKFLNLQNIMDEGKILFVNLSSGKGGKLTDDDRNLLGIMLVNEIFRLAKLRDYGDPNLKPFYCYIDEFANFVTRDIARAIEECRKFKISMVLAHQHLEQLKTEDPYLYASVLTNCKNKVVFGGLSFEDCELMTKELATGFLDLKRIKHEASRTYFAPVEEFIEVVSKSKTRTTGESKSQNEAWGSSNSNTTGSSESLSSSTNLRTNLNSSNLKSSSGSGSGRSKSHANNKNETNGANYSKGSSEQSSNSFAEGETRTLQPHTKHEERREISSTTFWSKDELMFLAMGEIKNQPVGVATIKIGSNRPVQVKISEVEEIFWDDEESPKMVEAFKAEVFKKHTQFYFPLEEESEVEEIKELLEPEEENPFNE